MKGVENMGRAKGRKALKERRNREFSRTAKRTRKINVKPRIMRGGIRL